MFNENSVFCVSFLYYYIIRSTFLLKDVKYRKASFSVLNFAIDTFNLILLVVELTPIDFVMEVNLSGRSDIKDSNFQLTYSMLFSVRTIYNVKLTFARVNILRNAF